jgi:hypothetical protein
VTSAPIVDVRSPAVWRELLSSGALGRVLRWQPVAAASAGAGAIGVADIVDSGLVTLRVAALMLAVGVGFVIDDASAVSSVAVPVSRAHQVTLRMTVGGLAVAVAFAAIAVPERRADVSVVTGVALEAAALVIAALAAAVIAHLRFDAAEPGFVGVGVVAAVVVTAIALPQQWALIASVGPEWSDAHLRWAGLLALGAAALIAGAREPATRRRLKLSGYRRGASTRAADQSGSPPGLSGL